MADPSGQTVILLRTFPDVTSDIAKEARMCVEYVQSRKLPPYIGPLVEETLGERELWLSPVGKEFWELCKRSPHAVLYHLSTLDRNERLRIDALDKLRAITRVHVVTPIPTEITDEVRIGMEIERDRLRGTMADMKQRIPWGRRVVKQKRHGRTYKVLLEKGSEMQIGRQLVGRSTLGISQAEILAWVQKKTEDMTPTRSTCRWIGDDWTYNRIKLVVREIAGRDSAAYEHWNGVK